VSVVGMGSNKAWLTIRIPNVDSAFPWMAQVLAGR